MKRIICLTIALCLVLGCFLPVYAVTIEDYKDQFTSGAAVEYGQYHIKEDQLGNYQETRATAVSDTTTHNLLNDLIRVFTGSGGTMYNSISELESWLTPVGSFNTSHSITEVTLYEIIDYIAWTLSGDGATVYDTLSSISSMSSYLPSINTFLNELKQSLSNFYNSNENNWTYVMKAANAHYNLLTNSNDTYNYPLINGAGTYVNANRHWSNGTPIGNLALLMKDFNNNYGLSYYYRWHADLDHYNDNLTTWDSQGSTLTQVGFTPDSAIQGLYRYLAFTQRDVARLTYTFANDEELEARELAQANQEQVMDDFIDPTGSGSASPSDFSSISDLSDGYKDNFGSSANVTGIFNIFSSNNMGWFSQETKNQLDTTSTTRSVSDTPLLDKQIQDIYEAIGVEPDESR